MTTKSMSRPYWCGAVGEWQPTDLSFATTAWAYFSGQCISSVEGKDADKINKVSAEEILVKISADIAYQNARKNSYKQNARIEHDKALQRVVSVHAGPSHFLGKYALRQRRGLYANKRLPGQLELAHLAVEGLAANTEHLGSHGPV